MQISQMHYLPLAPGFFAILVGFFFIVLILRSVRYAYESLGVSSSAAIFLLFATLIGSFFNIPIAELSPERVVSDQVVEFFGMRYVVPVVSNWGGTRGRARYLCFSSKQALQRSGSYQSERCRHPSLFVSRSRGRRGIAG